MQGTPVMETRLDGLTAKLYRVLADYRDGTSFKGEWCGFTVAADDAAELASRDRATLRVVVILNYHGIVVASHSMTL